MYEILHILVQRWPVHTVLQARAKQNNLSFAA